MTVKCQMCGAEFEGAAQAKFCIDCKKQRKRDRQRKKYLTEKHGPEVAERYLAAEKQRQEMNAVLEKASAAGLSYGQYVAEEKRREEAMDRKNEVREDKPGIIHLLITQAVEMLERSEVDCKEVGAAVGLLTAAQMILEGET